MESADKGRKRGPKKGVARSPKRALDHGFPTRLLAAMHRRRFVRPDGKTANAALAKLVHCSHAVIGQYLNQKKTNIDAILLLDLCDELSVTPFWLVKGEGSIDDVPLNKYPLQDVRKKTSPKRERIEVQ